MQNSDLQLKVAGFEKDIRYTLEQDQAFLNGVKASIRNNAVIDVASNYLALFSQEINLR